MKREQRLDILINGLKNENSEYTHLSVPVDVKKKQELLRALMNVRPPKPINPDWLILQDEELQEQLSAKGVIDINSLQRNGRFVLWQGDITRLNADAIVNAANSQMLGCFAPLHGCIDNAIHSAAGVQLRLACDQIMRTKGTPEPTGEAEITPAFNLPSKYVIHTVGPIVYTKRPTEKDRLLLEACYRNCLECAESKCLSSIAFCCISTGEFHYPNKDAAVVALDTVNRYFERHPTSTIKTVVFNVFKEIDYNIYKQLLSYEGKAFE
ncbi:MAG: protein-ADP-ribose hydrolase [Muribaculaceae bacterium]|nr:protein-ADP-ribose hydrolase [Muribaculaceae bacterium]MDE5594883.1 protein-ADP-ribose hydrolase [Muribaculaceae bacterium]